MNLAVDLIIEGLGPDDEERNPSSTNLENIDSNVSRSWLNQPQGKLDVTYLKNIYKATK
jgi:hypothetical protein